MVSTRTSALRRSPARRRRNEPARRGCVRNAFAGDAGAHEHSDAAPLLGGELQSPGFDLRKMLNARDRRAYAAAAQAFGQRPKLVRTFGAAEQNEMPKVDPRRRQGRQIKLALGIVPGDCAADLLRGSIAWHDPERELYLPALSAAGINLPHLILLRSGS